MPHDDLEAWSEDSGDDADDTDDACGDDGDGNNDDLNYIPYIFQE